MSSLIYSEVIRSHADEEAGLTTTSVFTSASHDPGVLHLLREETHTRDGERHGSFMEWDENGNLVKNGTYENDAPLGQWFDTSVEGGPYYIPQASGDIDLYLCAPTQEELDRRVTHLWETGKPDPSFVPPPLDVDFNL